MGHISPWQWLQPQVAAQCRNYGLIPLAKGSGGDGSDRASPELCGLIAECRKIHAKSLLPQAKVF